MKIISSFKDYYDGVGLGFNEQDIMYVRMPEFVAIKPQLQLFYKQYFSSNDKNQDACIFVCGKAYPFIFERELVIDGVKDIKASKVFNEVFNEKEKRYFKKIWFSSEEYEIDNKSKDKEKKYRYFWWGSDKKYRQSFFDLYKGKDFTQLHLQVDCPIILALFSTSQKKNKDGLEIIKNPCLRELDFARMMPPTTIFQEIEMFLGNVLVKDIMPQSDQSDIEKIISHGFDRKISFRKQKNIE